MAYITPEDLAVFAAIDYEVADAMIADATAKAVLAAPCLADESQFSDIQLAAIKAILRAVILRRHEAGVAGTRTQFSESAGPFSQSQTTEVTGSRGLFWPSEIADLQALCKQVTGSGQARAFNVDQVNWAANGHQPWCSITWGGWCSCGASLTRNEYPLWEGGLLS